ncbi:hypothetical protein ACFFTT_24505, partial [Actinoplanes octamycinicus]
AAAAALVAAGLVAWSADDPRTPSPATAAAPPSSCAACQTETSAESPVTPAQPVTRTVRLDPAKRPPRTAAAPGPAEPRKAPKAKDKAKGKDKPKPKGKAKGKSA